MRRITSGALPGAESEMILTGPDGYAWAEADSTAPTSSATIRAANASTLTEDSCSTDQSGSDHNMDMLRVPAWIGQHGGADTLPADRQPSFGNSSANGSGR